MNNQLSHSAANRFQQCAKSYEFHYVKRLREKTTSGALLFGSAMDSALNVLLTDKSKAPEGVFDKAFTFAKVGQKEVYVPECEQVVYASSDYDQDLLIDEDFQKIEEAMEKLSYNIGPLEDVIKSIADDKKRLGWSNLRSEQRLVYNLANWLCLRRKGHIMLQSYKEKVLPKIKSVKTVQRKITIANNKGDSIIGYVDAVLEWEDGKIVIFDNKTSSIEYDENAVLSSPQLTLYVHALEEEFKTRNAGFIVLRKGIIKNKTKICSKCFYKAEKGSRHKTCDQLYSGKRCCSEWNETIDPEAQIQILINEIPLRAEEIVMENYDSVNQLIKKGVFTRNFNSCVAPWGKCAFYRICWYNDYSEVDDLGEKNE